MRIYKVMQPFLICIFVIPLFFSSLIVMAENTVDGLLQADRAWAADANKSGIKKAFEIHAADNVVTIQPGQKPSVGYKAVLKSMEGLENMSVNWWPVAGDVSGDMGYTWGTYKSTITGDDGSKTIETGNYSTVWKHQSGKWKVVLDMTNQTPAKE